MVRHGDTELNSAERYWGATDVGLSEAGLRQAERLRDRLSTERIGAIYSSNLRRAVVTAETIASRHRSGIIACAEIRETDFGQLEGLTFAEISQRYPGVAELWRERSPKLVFPGGERLGGFDRRVGQFAERLKEHAAEDTVLVVAHSGSLRLLMCHLLGIGLEHRWQFRLDLASLSMLETYPEGAIISRLNDVSHLG